VPSDGGSCGREDATTSLWGSSNGGLRGFSFDENGKGLLDWRAVWVEKLLLPLRCLQKSEQIPEG
jgi:hypothetical protein